MERISISPSIWLTLSALMPARSVGHDLQDSQGSMEVRFGTHSGLKSDATALRKEQMNNDGKAFA
jgi:hypothetical protein